MKKIVSASNKYITFCIIIYRCILNLLNASFSLLLSNPIFRTILEHEMLTPRAHKDLSKLWLQSFGQQDQRLMKTKSDVDEYETGRAINPEMQGIIPCTPFSDACISIFTWNKVKISFSAYLPFSTAIIIVYGCTCKAHDLATTISSPISLYLVHL